MYRSIWEKLKQWKNKKEHKPLLLTGVRQCGKTYILKKFGAEEFADTIYIVFENNSRLASVFDLDYDTGRILSDLEIMAGKKISEGSTLVIFDEVQACPRAIASLKYFCEQKPRLHIVAAGSLLGAAPGESGVSFPVGKVDHLRMYPMSLYEFMLAEKKGLLLEKLAARDITQPLSLAYTAELEDCLRKYYFVGGMPEAVGSWSEHHDIMAVDKIQQNIIAGYEHDLSKYAAAGDVSDRMALYHSVPQQLAKENNKFVFSHVKQGLRAKDLERSLLWLENAGLILRLLKVGEPSLPLAMFADSTYYKVYMSDVGLLRSLYKVPYETLMDWRSDSIYARFRGALTENFVANELVSCGIGPYFWRSGNSAEVDFLFEDRGRAIPLEAKAEISTKAQSYRQYCRRFSPQIGFRVSMKNIGINEEGGARTVSLPLYMLWKIRKYL